MDEIPRGNVNSLHLTIILMVSFSPSLRTTDFHFK